MEGLLGVATEFRDNCQLLCGKTSPAAEEEQKWSQNNSQGVLLNMMGSLNGEATSDVLRLRMAGLILSAVVQVMGWLMGCILQQLMKAQLFQTHKLLILIICLALTQAHDNYRDKDDQCDHNSQTDCQTKCPGYFWSTSEAQCRRCQKQHESEDDATSCNPPPPPPADTCGRTSSEQVCETCPDMFYDSPTKYCLPCSSAAESSSCSKCKSKSSSQTKTENCPADDGSKQADSDPKHICTHSESSCEGKSCEETVYDNTTASCVNCSTADATLCGKCRSYGYDNSSQSCVKCAYNITDCDGCLNDTNTFCRKGCPHNFYLNSTRCLPEKIVNVTLVVNPSNLISDWNSLSKSERESRLASNLATIKQSIISLLGLKDESYRVKINKISVGSLNVDITVAPKPTQTVEALLQQTISAISANQQSSGMQVVGSSITVSENKEEASSSSESSAPIGIIVGIAAGVVVLSAGIFFVVKYLRRPKETELGETPLSSADTEKDVKTREAVAAECRSDEFELASTNSK